MIPDPAADRCSADDHCITCGDEGIAMRVASVEASEAICRDAGGEAHHVATDLVDPVGAGDQLLVHAGVAIRHLPAGPEGLDARGSAR